MTLNRVVTIVIVVSSIAYKRDSSDRRGGVVVTVACYINRLPNQQPSPTFKQLV